MIKLWFSIMRLNMANKFFVFLVIGMLLSLGVVDAEVERVYLDTQDKILSDVNLPEELNLEGGLQDFVVRTTQGGTLKPNTDIYTNKDEQKISFKEDGETITFSNLGKDSVLSFENEKLVFAKFTATKDTKYRLGEYEYDITEGSEVLFITQFDENGERIYPEQVTITLPSGGFVRKPKFVGEGDGFNEVNVDYELKDKGALYMETDEPGSFQLVTEYEGNELAIGFDVKRDAFYFGSPARLQNGLLIGTIETGKVYWFNDGKVHKGFDQPYISSSFTTKDFAAFAPKGAETPSITFIEGSNVGGMNIGKNDNLIIQALGKGNTLEGGLKFSGDSLIKISTKEGNIPKIETAGGYAIVDGNRLIRWNNRLKGGPRAWYIDSLNVKDSTTGKTNTLDFTNKDAVVMQIHSTDSQGNQITFSGVNKGKKPVDFDIFVSEEGDITTGRGKEIGVRNKVSFNNLNKVERATLLALSPDEQVKLLGKDKAEIKKVLAGERESQQNEARRVAEEKKKAEAEAARIKAEQQKLAKNRFFTSDVGRSGNLNFKYTKTSYLESTVAEGATLRIRVSEPSWCGNCRKPQDTRFNYLTLQQAEAMGYGEGSVPAQMIVQKVNGKLRVIKYEGTF